MTVVPLPTGLVPEHYRPVSDQLGDNARRFGDRICLQPVDGGAGLSWRGLAGFANRIGHLLEQKGIGAIDRDALRSRWLADAGAGRGIEPPDRWARG